MGVERMSGLPAPVVELVPSCLILVTRTFVFSFYWSLREGGTLDLMNYFHFLQRQRIIPEIDETLAQ
jgi:hypothetical protein